jgi:hypothetical protein
MTNKLKNPNHLWVVKIKYSHDKPKNPLLVVDENAIPTLQTKKPIAYGS